MDIQRTFTLGINTAVAKYYCYIFINKSIITNHKSRTRFRRKRLLLRKTIYRIDTGCVNKYFYTFDWRPYFLIHTETLLSQKAKGKFTCVLLQCNL